MCCGNLSPPPSRHSVNTVFSSLLAVAMAMWVIPANQLWAEGIWAISNAGLSKPPVGSYTLFLFSRLPAGCFPHSSVITWFHIIEGGNSIFFKSTKKISIFFPLKQTKLCESLFVYFLCDGESRWARSWFRTSGDLLLSCPGQLPGSSE